MDMFEHKLIASIYDAALEPGLWQPILREVCELTDADECALVFHDALNRKRNASFSGMSGLEANEIFVQEFIEPEIRRAREVFRDKSDGEVLSGREITELLGVPYEAYIGEAVEFHDRIDIAVRAGAKLMQSEFVTSTLGIHRKPFRPELTASSMVLLRQLMPHFARAVRIHNQLTAARNQSEQLLDALRRINTGVLLLDGDARVIFSNQEAARVLEQHPALQVGRFGRLYSPLPEQQLALQRLLRQAIERGCVSASSLALHHERRLQPLKLAVVPLAASGIVASFATENIAIAVFLVDVDRPKELPVEYLKQAYGLTITECVIAQALLNGASIAEVASQRGTTENTARWQTKSLMQKTFSKSQVELIRLLAALSIDLSLPIE